MATIFDNTIPADSEAFRLGASRIRDMKTTLQTLLSKIFGDTAGTWLTNAIPGTILVNASVTAAQIANATLTDTQLAPSGATAGVYDYVTVNAQGRVTLGANGLAALAISAATIDASTGNTFYKSITVTTAFQITNMAEGKQILVAITNGGGGGIAGAFTGVKWPGATLPTLTATVGRTDVFSFVQINSIIYGSVLQNLG